MTDIQKLRARRDQIEGEIARYREVITALEVKRNELDIAERVLAELAGEEIVSATPQMQTIREDRAKPVRPPKPPGLPTMADMIIEALRSIQKLGARGLAPADIAEIIRKKYWPEAPNEAVTPIVWRLWSKDKKLEKEDALYRLPDDQILDRHPLLAERAQAAE